MLWLQGKPINVECLLLIRLVQVWLNSKHQKFTKNTIRGHGVAIQSADFVLGANQVWATQPAAEWEAAQNSIFQMLKHCIALHELKSF